MNNSQKLFLLAVEDMNFTKAAARAYISQQCISEHIHRLEEEHGVTLFERRPKLKLTPAGQLMYQTLLQIQLLEKNLTSQLEMVSSGDQGHLTLGINHARLAQLLPRLFPAYHQAFPHVTLSFFHGDTVDLQRMLGEGRLDLALGIDADYDAQFKYTNLTSDRLYLVLSRKLLLERLPQFAGRTAELVRNGFPLDALSAIPLVMNNRSSTNYQAIMSCLNAAHIVPSCILQTSNYDIQVTACCTLQVGGFLPSIMIPRILEYNRTVCRDPEKQLLIFPLKEITKTLRIDCIYPRTAVPAKYLEALVQAFRQASLDYQSEVESYFSCEEFAQDSTGEISP